MDSSFELLSHTADMALLLRGETPDALVEPLRRGLYEIIGSLRAESSSVEHQTYRFEGENQGVLLRELASELLFLFEARKLIALHAEVNSFTNSLLEVSLHIAKLDHNRSELEREIKAVTHHALSYRELKDCSGDSYVEATLLVDL